MAGVQSGRSERGNEGFGAKRRVRNESRSLLQRNDDSIIQSIFRLSLSLSLRRRFMSRVCFFRWVFEGCEMRGFCELIFFLLFLTN